MFTFQQYYNFVHVLNIYDITCDDFTIIYSDMQGMIWVKPNIVCMYSSEVGNEIFFVYKNVDVQ